MRQSWLHALLLAGSIGPAGPAQAHERLGQYPHEVGSLVQLPPWQGRDRQDDTVHPWPTPPPMLGHHHATPKALHTTPWHYHPWIHCPPPYCLPSYHRHRLLAVNRGPLPVELILQRLKRHDYHSFGGVLLDGSQYWIDALNRYRQPVRLGVNAATGQIRGQVILPHD
ncbi:MAG TPA: hypothetical protein VLE23_07100 [Geminicoccaceae bacterium]|nr:hypothetical protein [Geminicoccaceae bacterium]